MKALFFIPATKLSKISHIKNIGVNEIIIDLEDAVSLSDLNLVLEELLLLEDKSCFVRVPVIKNECIDLEIITKLYEAGFNRFMLPKLDSYNDFKEVASNINFELESIILLIENPKILHELPVILENYSDFLYGVCLGSHDYISEIGGEYSLANLEYPRQMILTYARIYDILAIDIASMDIDDVNCFEQETLDGFKKGYDAKLLIHPLQLSSFKELVFYTQAEYDWAMKVIYELKKTDGIENFGPVVIDGKIVERPHIKKAKSILNWFNNR